MGIKIGKLTPKQTKLVALLAKQVKQHGKTNLTHAGLEVFDTTNPTSARVMASQELQNPSVRAAVEEAFSRAGISLETVAKNLQSVASVEVTQVSADAKIRANVEIAKLLNLYPDKKTAHLNLNVSGRFKTLDFSKAKQELESFNSELKTFLSDTED